MTVAEFKAWLEVTNSSKKQWMLDLIRLHNNGEYLFYRGGENGYFIQVHTDGTLLTGTYEGALPHIGDAIFKVRFSKKFDSRDEAIVRLRAVAGDALPKESAAAPRAVEKPKQNGTSLDMLKSEDGLKTFFKMTIEDRGEGLFASYPQTYLMYQILQSLFTCQTEAEKSAHYTKETNGIGFNKFDAPLLTDIAIKSRSYRRLSPAQTKLVAQKLTKYAGQLARLANR